MRILHTMLRVSDLNKSLDFYTNVLGMKLLRQQDYPAGEFTLAFVGFGDESETAVLELTYNWVSTNTTSGMAMVTSPSRWMTSTPLRNESAPKVARFCVSPGR